MPLIDLRCINTDTPHDFEYMRPLSEWPATPLCPTCGCATIQMHYPRAVASFMDPIVVFKAPDGTFRVPGEADGKSARKYEAMGYTRIECRNAIDVRRVETAMSRTDRAQMERSIERRAMQREAREREQRATLRGLMTSMSPFGRDLAREAMRRNDGKPREYAKDPGVHVQALAYDRGNREESRDAQGRRRRD